MGAQENSVGRVLIVGAGPVGMTLALDLARQGVGSILIDKKPEIQWTSRATCVSRRSQEILRRIGVSKSFFERALPWHKGRTFHRNRQVFELSMPFEPVRDQDAPMVNLQQYYTEQALLEAIESMPDIIDLRWSTELRSVSQDIGSVTATLGGPDGQEDQIRCDYLAGCDGGRSTVRTATGLKLHGRTYEGRYLISDIKLADPGTQPVERWVWFDPDSNRGSTAILHLQPDDTWRIDVQVDSAIPDEVLLEEQNVRKVVQSHLDMMGVASD